MKNNIFHFWCYFTIISMSNFCNVTEGTDTSLSLGGNTPNLVLVLSTTPKMGREKLSISAGRYKQSAKMLPLAHLSRAFN